MDVTLSLDEECINYFNGIDDLKRSYFGSLCLADAFNYRNHKLKIIHPNDIYKKNNMIFSKRVFSFDRILGFNKIESNSYLSGDLFFIYGLGEDKENPKISRKFMDYLYLLENQYFRILNSAESTSYEFKPKQKTLRFPWIPHFEVKSKNDLEELVLEEKIIAKPCIGCASRGILYLSNKGDLEKIDNINDYLYERFIPAEEERRYIFLNNELMVRRKMKKYGIPGNEIVVDVNLFEGNDMEVNIAKEVMRKIGMFYGAVDFRGNYILEINGSGTCVCPPTIENKNDDYNLSSSIVEAVEKELESSLNSVSA